MEDELRREYDLKSLEVRRLGAARKSFGGQLNLDFTDTIRKNKITGFFLQLIQPIRYLNQRHGSIEFHTWKRDVEEKLGQLPRDSERYLQEFKNIDFDKNYESALNEAQVLLQSCRDNLINSKPAIMKQQNSSVSSPTNEIFIVHGHDEEMKQTVARTLEALKLQPIILHEQSNQGATIIEKFEKNANVQFAIILLSPDDMAYKKTESSEKAKPRARQNVIFEFGYFIGKLSRAQVFVLKQDDKKDKLELPTDILGITYTPYDSGDSWKLKLVQALKATGYSVDANNLPT